MNTNQLDYHKRNDSINVTNLCPNGGFESNLTGWIATNGATITRDSTQGLFGTTCLKSVTSAGGAGGQGFLSSPISSYIPVQPLTRYMFSMYVKGEPQANHNLQAREYDSSNVAGVTYNGQPFVTTGQWQRVSMMFVTVATSAKVYLRLINNTGNALVSVTYADGIQLELGTTATPYIETNGASVVSAINLGEPIPLLTGKVSSFEFDQYRRDSLKPVTNLHPNGGFEVNTASWAATANATLTRDTIVSLFGGASGRVSTQGVAASEGITVGTFIPILPSTAYTASAYVKGPAGATLWLAPYERDASHANVQFDTAVPVTLTGAWQRLTATRVSHPSAAELGFRIFTNVPQAMTFWVDGVQLEVGNEATPYVDTNGASAARNYALGEPLQYYITPPVVTADANTVYLSLTPSSAETADTVDQAAVTLNLTPSGTELAGLVDAAAVNLLLVPSSSDSVAYVESGAATLGLLPSGTELQTSSDSNTLSLKFTPSTPVEVYERSDAATAVITFTPSGSDTHSTGSITYVDSQTAVLTFTPGGVETSSLVDGGLLRLSLTPSTAAEAYAQAVYLRLTPAGYEYQIAVDLVGTIAAHYTATFVGARYDSVGTSHFTSVKFSTRWNANEAGHITWKS